MDCFAYARNDAASFSCHHPRKRVIQYSRDAAMAYSLFETVDQKPNKLTVVAGGWNCPVSGVFRG
jgi:hypothetical protein